MLMDRMRAATILAVSMSVLLTGCDAYVEKAKYDELQKKLDETTKGLVDAKDELGKAREKIGEYQAHRYEIFKSGFRTWRLDTVTGKSCILLTTDSDWKT